MRSESKFNTKLTFMNTKQLLINRNMLRYLIECRSDSTGKECFYVTFSNCRVAFRNMDSVLDFLTMNKSIGYVE